MDVNSIRRIERLNYMLGGVLIATAALLMPRDTALGVLVGVVLACANFSIMRRVIPGWMRAASHNGGGARGLFLVPKMALLMLAVVLALAFLPIAAEGLAIGFSIFLLSIAIETVRYMSSSPADPSRADGNDSGAGDSER
ncbi:MAG: hypothetical protein MJE77_41635 [Proteobacteria bacterium]|nr:hypothetical protein [Pseudomonadota bacterium]